MACITYTTKPAVRRKVGHAGVCVLGDYLQIIDFFMSVDFIVCLDHSCYTQGRIAQLVVYRLHDQKIVGSIPDSTQKYFSLRKCQK